MENQAKVKYNIYHIVLKAWWGKWFGKFTLFEQLAKGIWQINRSTKALLIVSTIIVWMVFSSLVNNR